MAFCNNPSTESEPGYQKTAVMETERGIQQEGQKTGAEVMNNGHEPSVGEPYENYNDCFRVVRSTKRVEIPCTRNEYQRYKVKVPKQVHEKIPRRVEYTDYESRERKEPYSVKRFETAYREEDQQYTIQVPKKVTKMVKVTRKEPRTVYVNIVTEEPREETIMVSETRTRRVKVPYQKEVIDQQYRTVTERVPVTKFRTEYDTITKTIYEDTWRTKMVPVTKIVHKEIPVYNVVRNEDCGNCVQVMGYPASNNHLASNNHVGQAIQVTESAYNDHMKQYPQTYPHYVETHPQPELTVQGVPQYEQQPVMHARVMQNPDPAPVIQYAPVVNNVEPIEVMQPSEVVNNQGVQQYEPQLVMHAPVMQNPDPAPVVQYAPVVDNAKAIELMQPTEMVTKKEAVRGLDNAEPAQLVNASETHVEQKLEKEVETKYSESLEYDSKKDETLDAQELQNAQERENAQLKEGGTVGEEVFAQPPRQNSTRKRKGGRRRRKNRR